MSITKPTRLNRAGIPVLDEPRNGLREKDERRCPPGQHRWRKTARAEYRDGEPRVLWECRSCPEESWEIDDGRRP